MSREFARAAPLADPRAAAALPVAEVLALARDAYLRAADAAGDDVLALLEFPHSILGPVLSGPRAMEALAAMGSSPAEAAALFEAQSRRCAALAEGIAGWGDVPAALFMDDLAGNAGTFISPATLRALYFPRFREVAAILSRGGVRVLFHSDGDLGAVHREILQAGAAGHHPVEPVGGWTLERAAAGPGVVLIGNAAVGRIAASPQAAEAEARRCLAFGERHAAYFLAPAAEVHPDVSAEAWLAFFHAA
jgi:uroporphyrinogen-III decarboxylase